MYEFLSELITGLCETKEYSSADHGSRRHAIKLTLEKMAKVDDIQWLECQHYRELLPDQLEELFGTVFNKTDSGDGDQVFIQQFKAARRALDTFAFGSSTHPTYHRVSPRLKEYQQGQQQRKRDREAGSDVTASERSSQITRKMHAEATSAEPKGQLAEDRKVYVPDGSLRVKHPLEMRRYPDVDKITGLTEKLYQKINALLHVASPFTFKNDHWVDWVECCFLTKVVLFFNIRIHVHSYACVCIHMHFIVFCMHSDALHSTIWLHSNAFCNHFELLHSSDARRLHSDAFSYLLHSRHVTF